MICGLISSASAQTLNDAFAKSLAEQGFVIESTKFTWLRRIVVQATNGTHNREIVVTRGSGRILQDNWSEVTRSQEESSEAPSNKGKDRAARDKKDDPNGLGSPGGKKKSGNGEDGKP